MIHRRHALPAWRQEFEGRTSRSFIEMALRSKLAYLCVATSLLAFQLAARKPIYEWYQALLAWALIVPLLYETYRYVRAGARDVPYTILIPLQFYITYGIAVVMQGQLRLIWGMQVPGERSITMALLLANASCLLYLALYRAGNALRVRLGLDIWRGFSNVNYLSGIRVRIYALMALAVWYISMLSPWVLPVSIRNVVVMIVSPYLALSILVFAWYRSRLEISRFFLLSYLAVLFLFGLLSGSMENLLLPFVGYVAGSQVWRGKLLSKTILVGATLFLLLNPVKTIYREYWWNSTDAPTIQTIGGRLEYWKESIQGYIEDPRKSETAVESVGSRVSGLLQLAQITEDVPDNVPYRKVDWLRQLAFSLIPRVIWPNKPTNTELLLHDYALTFGYQTTEGLRSSTTGATMLIEGYWEAGWWGGLLFPSLFGLLLGFFLSTERSKSVTDTAKLISLAFMAANIQLLMPLGTAIASLPSFFVGTWIALAFLTVAGSERTKQPDKRART
jgi:hypothetical protein